MLIVTSRRRSLWVRLSRPPATSCLTSVCSTRQRASAKVSATTRTTTCTTSHYLLTALQPVSTRTSKEKLDRAHLPTSSARMKAMTMSRRYCARHRNAVLKVAQVLQQTKMMQKLKRWPGRNLWSLRGALSKKTQRLDREVWRHLQQNALAVTDHIF